MAGSRNKKVPYWLSFFVLLLTLSAAIYLNYASKINRITHYEQYKLFVFPEWFLPILIIIFAISLPGIHERWRHFYLWAPTCLVLLVLVLFPINTGAFQRFYSWSKDRIALIAFCLWLGTGISIVDKHMPKLKWSVRTHAPGYLIIVLCVLVEIFFRFLNNDIRFTVRLVFLFYMMQYIIWAVVFSVLVKPESVWHNWSSLTALILSLIPFVCFVMEYIVLRPIGITFQFGDEFRFIYELGTDMSNKWAGGMYALTFGYGIQWVRSLNK